MVIQHRGIKMANILVTGGAGFIGSHLVEELIKEKPDSIIVVDNFYSGSYSNLRDAEKNFKYLKIYNCDVSNYDALKIILSIYEIDIVFNLAVTPLPTSLYNPYTSFEINTKIVQNICELQRLNYFKTLIHFSSSEVYGTAEYVPMDEKHPLNGTTPYAASKSSGDQLIYAYHKTFGIDYSIIRPFNNYGPRQNSGKDAGVIPFILKRIANGKEIIINGDGQQTRDYIRVIDVAKAAVEIYKNKDTRSKVINIGSGNQIHIGELILKICNVFNYDNITYGKERIGDVRCHQADISLARELINYIPTSNDTMADIIKYVRGTV